MKRIMRLSGGILIIALILTSCKKDDTTVPSDIDYIKMAENTSANSSYTLEMCSCEQDLFVGYNRLYFQLRDKASNQLIKQASLNLRPVMDMGTFTHACPVENPDGTSNSDGYFEGVVLFSMPGNNSWSLDVDITALGVTDSVHYTLSEVVATTPARKIVAIDSLETSPGVWKITKYPISLVRGDPWKVGLNKFEFTIHQMKGYFSFPAVTDMAIEIEPEMPSMGHGSPNNVNPVYIGNGHYSGTVNLTMTGDWRIHMTLYRENRLISNRAYFDIVF